MLKKAFFLSLITTAFLLIPAQGFSQNNANAPHRMWEDLGLTAEQKAKLLAMHNGAQNDRSKQREEISAVRLKIKEELGKSNPSKSVLSGYVNELGQLHEKQIQNQIDHLLQMKIILTPEQFQKVISKQWRGDRFGKMQGNRGGCDRKADSTSCQHMGKKNHPNCDQSSHM